MKGWCFLRHVNGGRLYVTRMFADFTARQGISRGAVEEGYYNTPNFTIMQAIYYLSSLAETTNDLRETPINGMPGQVTLPYAGNSTVSAPTIQQPQPPPLPGQGDYYGGQGGYQGGYQVLGGYDQAKLSQFQSGVDYKIFQFEPWNPENILGPKNWIAKVLPSKTRVVLKLWDAWKFDDTAQNHEASIYLHL